MNKKIIENGIVSLNEVKSKFYSKSYANERLYY